MRKFIYLALIVAAFGFFIHSLMSYMREIEYYREWLNSPDNPERITAAQRIPEEPTQMPEDGWHGVFTTPTHFREWELEEIIAASPHYTETRQTRAHPPRQMTERERTAWISEYNAMGGVNAQEFEMYMIVNAIRAEYGLPPFILCPRLSRASRLFSYLQVKYHTVGHDDIHYGGLMERANFFGALGTLYMENANSEQWHVLPDGERKYIYMTPQELVDGWMSSDAHRAHILNTETTHVGFGIDSGNNRVVPTMKSIAPRH